MTFVGHNDKTLHPISRKPPGREFRTQEGEGVVRTQDDTGTLVDNSERVKGPSLKSTEDDLHEGGVAGGGDNRRDPRHPCDPRGRREERINVN